MSLPPIIDINKPLDMNNCLKVHMTECYDNYAPNSYFFKECTNTMKETCSDLIKNKNKDNDLRQRQLLLYNQLKDNDFYVDKQLFDNIVDAEMIDGNVEKLQIIEGFGTHTQEYGKYKISKIITVIILVLLAIYLIVTNKNANTN